jgi:integrase
MTVRVAKLNVRKALALEEQFGDPVNVRGVKDLLGHATFNPTDTYYIMNQSRVAGRKLAFALDQIRK